MSFSPANFPGRPFFVLASTSPRRRQLLTALGVSFVVIRPTLGGLEIDESPLPGESPPALVARLSRIKAEAGLKLSSPSSPGSSSESAEEFPVIFAADTEVVLDDKILGKPGRPAEAAAMLRALRRQSHFVYSGLTVTAGLPGGRRFITRVHRSQVWMRPYTEAEIAAYVSSGAPLDKAGAYGIQDQPFSPVARWEGCYASIMGLPLGELAAALAEIGLVLPDVASPCSTYTGQPCCQLA